MSRVLLTGATTPLGARLADALVAEGLSVLAIGVEPPGEAPLVLSDQLQYQQVDLTRSRAVRRLLFGPARDVTAVIHTVAHRRAADQGPSVHRINVKTTRTLLWLAEQHPTIESFIYRSTTAVYRISSTRPGLIREDHPLDLSASASQWVRDRVEADLVVCTRTGISPLRVVVLRMAELLAPLSGSQLHDYLASRVCLRPMGFDPMLNLLSIEDAVAALQRALHSSAQGVINIPGCDTLPLSRVIEKHRRVDVALPGPLLPPLYRLRALVRGRDFRYQLNQARFHFGGVPDGDRAVEVLGYQPQHPLRWASECGLEARQSLL